MSRAVELKVAGQAYRVVTSADEGELSRLAERVEEALFAVTPKGRAPSPQSLVLAAITLAHELEEERAKFRALEERYKATLGELLGRVDRILGEGEVAEVAAPSGKTAERWQRR